MAESQLSNEALAGSWHLKSFTITKDGETTEWCGGSKGLLLYSVDGFMSVAIQANAFESVDESTLFYAGRYQIVGQTVHHDVNIAVNQERVGQILIRNAKLAGDQLVLSASGDFGDAAIDWRRSE